jgi:mono/diheme cytochrome c family protein
MKRLPRPLVAAVLALVLAGCSSSEQPSSQGSAGAAPAAATPAASNLDAGPRAAEGSIDEALAEQGEKLFKDKGCSACHTFGQKLTGPDLAGVSERRTARWIETQILDPQRMVKEDPVAKQLFATHMLQMPDQGLTEAEAKALVEFFKDKDHD